MENGKLKTENEDLNSAFSTFHSQFSIFSASPRLGGEKLFGNYYESIS